MRASERTLCVMIQKKNDRTRKSSRKCDTQRHIAARTRTKRKRWYDKHAPPIETGRSDGLMRRENWMITDEPKAAWYDLFVVTFVWKCIIQTLSRNRIGEFSKMELPPRLWKKHSHTHVTATASLKEVPFLPLLISAICKREREWKIGARARLIPQKLFTATIVQKFPPPHATRPLIPLLILLQCKTLRESSLISETTKLRRGFSVLVFRVLLVVSTKPIDDDSNWPPSPLQFLWITNFLTTYKEDVIINSFNFYLRVICCSPMYNSFFFSTRRKRKKRR